MSVSLICQYFNVHDEKSELAQSSPILTLDQGLASRVCTLVLIAPTSHGGYSWALIFYPQASILFSKLLIFLLKAPGFSLSPSYFPTDSCFLSEVID